MSITESIHSKCTIHGVNMEHLWRLPINLSVMYPEITGHVDFPFQNSILVYVLWYCTQHVTYLWYETADNARQIPPRLPQCHKLSQPACNTCLHTHLLCGSMAVAAAGWLGGLPPHIFDCIYELLHFTNTLISFHIPIFYFCLMSVCDADILL